MLCCWSRDLAPFKNFIINRFGIVPKSTPGKWHLITDLYFRHGKSVNCGIPPESCHVSCPGIPEAVDEVMKYGRGLTSKSLPSFPVRESIRSLFVRYVLE